MILFCSSWTAACEKECCPLHPILLSPPPPTQVGIGTKRIDYDLQEYEYSRKKFLVAFMFVGPRMFMAEAQAGQWRPEHRSGQASRRGGRRRLKTDKKQGRRWARPSTAGDLPKQVHIPCIRMLHLPHASPSALCVCRRLTGWVSGRARNRAVASTLLIVYPTPSSKVFCFLQSLYKSKLPGSFHPC